MLQEELGSKLTKETHVVFAADRKSLNWTMGDDLNGWNSMCSTRSVPASANS
ncbi:MAG: hypothetical protein ACLSFT_01925 [Ruminococcus callidus]